MGEISMEGKILSEEKRKHSLRTILIIACILIGICSEICAFLYGKSKSTKVAVDFSLEDKEVKAEWDYPFLPQYLSDYICELSRELGLDADLGVAILIAENPEFNVDAMHLNENGTIDCGLFQLNDKYVWTTFRTDYWFENIELDPFNWKHNTYLALHHIQSLQKQLKVQDDIIQAYNCGIGAVMNGKIPPSTKSYLAKVKNNLILLKK